MFPTLLLFGVLVSAPADPDVTAADKAAQLVAELGHSSYRVRESAAKELVKFGGAALEALRQGSTHPDAEIAERCKKLIPQALDRHLQDEVDRFLVRADGPIPKDLPRIARWVKLAGTGKESRQLYAQMVREQRKVLIEIEQDPAKAPARFRQFVQEIYNRGRTTAATVVTAPTNNVATYPELLLFLFLSGDPVLKRDANPAVPVPYVPTTVFLNSSHLAGMLSGTTANDATRRLFLSWLENERNITLLRRGFLLAAEAGLKDAAPIAIGIATDKQLAPTVRIYPLMAGGKLFTKDHLKDLAKLMDDTTLVGKTSVNGQVASVEIRDIALGIAVRATDQKPADYGFERYREPTAATGTSFSYYSLTDKQREDAFKKWKAWQAQQPE